MKSNKPGYIFEPLSDKYLAVKPCPFCGSIDLDTIEDRIIHCTNCGGRGPDWHYRLERAIPYWNGRSNEPL